MAQAGLGGQQHVFDDHTSLGRRVQPVVDGRKGRLRAGAVEVVHQRLHGLEGRFVGFGQGVFIGKALDLFEHSAVDAEALGDFLLAGAEGVGHLNLREGFSFLPQLLEGVAQIGLAILQAGLQKHGGL